jgi:hypothetical protein
LNITQVTPRTSDFSPQRRPDTKDAWTKGAHVYKDRSYRPHHEYHLEPTSTYVERLHYCAPDNPERTKLLKPFTPDSLARIYGKFENNVEKILSKLEINMQKISSLEW